MSETYDNSQPAPVGLITWAVFAQLFPRANDATGFVDAINKLCPPIGVDNNEALKVFLAQCSWESAHFTALVENLNYSAAGLMAVFPTHFNINNANDYSRQPEKIANHVYANRYGNGDEASGDGWQYRGRGAIGLTFKDNYQAFATANNIALEDAVIYCTTTEGAIATATFFWQKHHVPCGSRDDMEAATRIINGGISSLPQRLDEYDRIATVLG